MIKYRIWQTNIQQNLFPAGLKNFTKAVLHKQRLQKILVFLKRWCLVGLRNLESNQELLKKETNGMKTIQVGKVKMQDMPQYIIGSKKDLVKLIDVFTVGLQRLTEVPLSGQTLDISTKGI